MGNCSSSGVNHWSLSVARAAGSEGEGGSDGDGHHDELSITDRFKLEPTSFGTRGDF